MPQNHEQALVWFRRDLRADDHAALSHALRAARNVWCAFVFDRTILNALPPEDRRVEFIHASVAELDGALAERGGGLIVLDGDPVLLIPKLAAELRASAVYANHDDDPYARARDARVRTALRELGIDLRTRKDHVIFERDELLTVSGKPFSVFTPYKSAWLAKLDSSHLAPHSTQGHTGRLAPPPEGSPRLAALTDIGFRPTNLRDQVSPGANAGDAQLRKFAARIGRYADERDLPASEVPSRLGVHLRFGTISIRACAREAHSRMLAGSRGAAVWLAELIWRDFFHQVLHHYPHVVDGAFRREYDAVEWEQGARADELFAAWCEGRTGYPLVDAAMHQLNSTGYMHNRLRMLTASFLAKDLGIDWRRGERYFALRLDDFDLAANNGGWQWAASTGCDAQPYFRIFNPVSQSRKFDAEGAFIRRFVPALERLPTPAIHEPWSAPPLTLAAAGVELGVTYPNPVVEHAAARRRALERYGAARAVARRAVE